MIEPIDSWRYSFGIEEKVHALLSFSAFREDGERCEADANNNDDNVRSLSSSAETRALPLRATAKTHMYRHTRTRRVYDARRSRAYYERGDQDRAIAEYRYTCVHGPRSSPRTPTTSRPSLSFSVYRDRVMAKPNPRFRIPSSALSGEALSDPPSFACLTACLPA